MNESNLNGPVRRSAQEQENEINKKIDKLKSDLKDELFKIGAIDVGGTKNGLYQSKKEELESLLQLKKRRDDLIKMESNRPHN